MSPSNQRNVTECLRSTRGHLRRFWHVRATGAWANIPPKRNRKEPICFSPCLYSARNLVERLFNKIEQCRRIATRYDKLAANYLAFIKLAAIRIRLRVYESRHANGGGRTGFQEIRGGSFPHMRSTGVLDLDFNAALQ